MVKTSLHFRWIVLNLIYLITIICTALLHYLYFIKLYVPRVLCSLLHTLAEHIITCHYLIQQGSSLIWSFLSFWSFGGWTLIHSTVAASAVVVLPSIVSASFVPLAAVVPGCWRWTLAPSDFSSWSWFWEIRRSLLLFPLFMSFSGEWSVTGTGLVSADLPRRFASALILFDSKLFSFTIGFS